MVHDFLKARIPSNDVTTLIHGSQGVCALDFGFGRLGKVGLQLRQRIHMVHDFLERGVFRLQVRHLEHHLQVVVHAGEHEVSPGQLKQGLRTNKKTKLKKLIKYEI